MKGVLAAFAVAAAASKLPVEAVTVGGLKIVFAETTFSDVARKFGRLMTQHRGDAGDSRTQGCYTTGGRKPIVFYLESTEMGGGTDIMELDVTTGGAPIASHEPAITAACTRLFVQQLDVRTDRGVMLGMRRAEVEHLLGGKGREEAGVTVYEASEQRRDKRGLFDASSELRLRYVAGRVVAFHAGAVYTS